MPSLTKEDLISSGNVSSQQALVEKLLENAVRSVKRVIPGGKTILKTLDKEDMEKAIYNWLRGCRHFSHVKISFAKEPDKFITHTNKVHSYDTRDSRPVWERNQEGKRALARDLAKHIISKPIVAIEARPDGIYLHEDKEKRFAPTVVVTEDLKRLPEFTSFELGEKAPSPEWEPFVEFMPTNKSKYSVLPLPE